MAQEMATMNGAAKKTLFVPVAVISAALLLLAACGNPNAKFCEIAGTSTQKRTQAEIDAYYEQLEAAAPVEIKDDVTTLRKGWRSVSFPLGGGKLSRPGKVSEAARNVYKFVGDVCGTRGGVYLVQPEIGF
jgi:hypothetical protein